MDKYPLGCPCGYRPPRTDDLDAWNAWYDHIAEAHSDHQEGCLCANCRAARWRGGEIV